MSYQATANDLRFSLHPKQGLAFNSQATEILYGGAAGGGKSHLLRVLATALCTAIPDLQVYIFRRIREDLIKPYMEGPTGFYALLAPWIGDRVQIIEDEIRFWNGARIYLAHCKDEKDKLKYLSADIHVLMPDELTQFTDSIYRFLRSRVRMPEDMKAKLPANYRDKLPCIIAASNPGGIGHQFVKSTWIDGFPPLKVWKTPVTEGGFLRQYIPANLSDNPSLNYDSYSSTLSGLGNPALVKAMLEGDWDIVSGAALDLQRATHMVRPFKPPKHWTKFQGLDWGYVRPYSIGWFCVVEGDTLLEAKGHHADVYLPDKAVVMYRELYGSTGKPNEGAKDESPIVAKRILAMEKEAQETMDYRVADTQLWAKNDGPSMYERMHSATGGAFNPIQSIKDRQANYAEFCNRLRGEEVEKNTYVPMFYITENCTDFWRTVPPLILDELNPEKGPGEAQENHVYDMCAYSLMSRPFITTKEQRIERKFYGHRKLMNENADPYRVNPLKAKRN